MSIPQENPGAPVPTARLLRTKLFLPRPHPDRVDRPRLVGRLEEGAKCKLTLVAAPAGFGKTTLLSSWIAQSRRPAAWIALDLQDNDPIRFWSYFVAALQTLQSKVGVLAQQMLVSPQPPPLESILAELLNTVGLIAGDFVLVLDDYHALDNESIHSALTFLIDNLPPSMHLVIVSRAEPPLPLARWRARREMVALSSAVLRFTADEAAAFLNHVMGLGLTADDLGALERLTEGWIAALQLAALSMQGLSDRTTFIRSFAGSHRYIFDYLAQEVLSRQPEDIQSFMLQTSVLERLSGSLCDAVLNRSNSQTVMEKIEQANLFLVPLDQQRQWYRYHHLFADFLRTRLEQVAPAAIAGLHRRASAWHEQNHLLPGAVRHALAAGDFEQAASLIKRGAGYVFEGGDLPILLRWLAELRPAVTRADPVLEMIEAWALLATSQFDAVEARLQTIEAALGVVADGSPATLALPASIRGALGEILCIRANLAFHRQDLPRVLALSKQASAYLSDDVERGLFHTRSEFESVISFNMALAYEFSGDLAAATKAFDATLAHSPPEFNFALFQMASSHLAGIQVLRGQLRHAMDIYTRTLESSAAHPSPIAGLLHAGRGNVLYEWNQLDAAQVSLTQAVELGKQWSNWETLLPGFLGLAHLERAQGNLEAAHRMLDEVSAIEQRSKAPWGASLIDAYRARLWTLEGKRAAVARWAEGAGLEGEQEISALLEPAATILARVLIDLDRPDEASRLGARLLSAAELHERWGRVVKILAVQALALDAQGQDQLALGALARALELAAPEGYVRVFVDQGEPMAALLRKLETESGRTEGSSQAKSSYTRTLLASFRQHPVSENVQPSSLIHPKGPLVVHPLIEPLSQRELDVLRLLANGMTNQEIAEQLVLSLNTIKTHVKNIHSKLGTRNRTQATTRARELGLL